MTPKDELRFDEIGYWSEVKLEIVKKYAAAYTTVFSKKFSFLKTVYVDAFAGAGQHISESTGEFVPGSPLNALLVEPPFSEYHFVDLNEKKVANLKQLAGDRKNVHIHHDDCNRVLLENILPTMTREKYRRGLCLLDPYGLHLDWKVIEKAGKLGTIDMFLNFPIMDMNRNALWRNPDGVNPEDAARMTTFWGDETWRTEAYREAPTLFGVEQEKVSNDDIAESFRTRLKNVAGFAHVPKPMPMRNGSGAIVYYLYFASSNPTGNRIASQIFTKFRDKGIR